VRVVSQSATQKQNACDLVGTQVAKLVGMSDETNFNPKVQASGGGDDSGKIRRTAVGSGGGDEFGGNKYWFYKEGGPARPSPIDWVITYAIESLGHALAEMPPSNNYSGLAEVAEAHFRRGWGGGEKDVFADLAPLAIELVVSAFCVAEARCDASTLKQAFPSFSAQQFVQLEWLVAKYGNKPA
jgi:hypothetical protein